MKERFMQENWQGLFAEPLSDDVSEWLRINRTKFGHGGTFKKRLLPWLLRRAVLTKSHDFTPEGIREGAQVATPSLIQRHSCPLNITI